LPVALWAIFGLPELQWHHGRLADGVHKPSNIRDSPSAQVVVSFGKKPASVLKNEALLDNSQRIGANNFAPPDLIASVD
jgi:hypothetical protein